MKKKKSEIEQFHELCNFVRKVDNPVTMGADALLCLEEEIFVLEAEIKWLKEKIKNE